MEVIMAAKTSTTTANTDVAPSINWSRAMPPGPDTRVKIKDGSLTICVQADEPSDPARRANWLPAPKGDFSLYVRAYWPKVAVTDGLWTPPPVEKQT
jgi:hypothetical protein